MSILAMPITIITPNETFTLDVEPSDSIDTVKGLVEQQTSIAQARQIITFNGQALENGRSLSDYNVQKNSILNVAKSNVAPSLSVSAWESLGSTRFAGSSNSGNHSRIRLDANDVPWVIFADTSEHNGSVMKFNGTDWEYVGNKNIANGDIYYTDIIFDSNNTPYISFADEGNSGRLRVLSFNGSNWNDVGSLISSGLGFYSNLAFDNNGVLHVVYNDSNFSN